MAEKKVEKRFVVEEGYARPNRHRAPLRDQQKVLVEELLTRRRSRDEDEKNDVHLE